jgi:hypothetical protein
VGASDHQQHPGTQRELALLKSIQLGQTPPELGYRVHQIVLEAVESQDTYITRDMGAPVGSVIVCQSTQ